MRNMLWTLILIFGVISGNNLYAHGGNEYADQRQGLVDRAAFLYDQINFSNCDEKLSKDAFIEGYVGYINLKEAGQISGNKYILTICDFSMSANKKRMWVIDLKRKKVLINSLVAHGQGTGEEYATNFSNTPESHKSSIGFFVTKNTYNGNNGYSLKLEGMDYGYNHKAMERAIVVHGADYVSEQFIRDNNRLGRSWGCPALPQATAQKTIDMIKNGNCFFIYYPNKRYAANCKWLKSTPNLLDNSNGKKQLQAQVLSDSTQDNNDDNTL